MHRSKAVLRLAYGWLPAIIMVVTLSVLTAPSTQASSSSGAQMTDFGIYKLRVIGKVTAPDDISVSTCFGRPVP